jgi:hypothetical protein
MLQGFLSMASKSVPEGAEECYREGQAICQEVLKPTDENDPQMLQNLEKKLKGLPDNADTAAIREQVQALQDDLNTLKGIMLDGKGRTFDNDNSSGKVFSREELDRMEPESETKPVAKESLDFKDSVNWQACNVQKRMQSLKQAFEDLETQAVVETARANVAGIRNTIEENKTVIAAASAEINSLIMELGPRKEVPKESIKQAITNQLNGTCQECFVEHKGEASGLTSHWAQDYREIAKNLLDGGEMKCIPPSCWFRMDAFRSFNFVLQIGDVTIEGKEIVAQNENGLTDELRAQTMKKIVDTVCTFATEHTLDPEAVLGNLLRIYQGQTTIFAMLEGVAETLSDDKLFYTFTSDNWDTSAATDSFGRITIDESGSCCVSHNASLPSMQVMERGTGVIVRNIPCDIQVTMAYTSSLDDFTNGLPPHAVEDQCTGSGHCLDMGAMA